MSTANDSTIRDVRLRRHRFPMAEPFRSASVVVEGVHMVIIEMVTKSGVIGLGSTFSFTAADAEMIHIALSVLAEAAKGQDVMATTALWTRLSQTLAFVGNGGPALAAMSALDIAAWDAKAKCLNLPMHRLLGAARADIPAYASAGSLVHDPAGLAKEMEGHASEGFRAFKIKLGASITNNIARLEALRSALGEDVEIYVDANQQWSAGATVQAARELERFRLGWLEEPLPATHIDRLAEVRKRIAMPIATGETNYGLAEFDQLIVAESADILMPNLQRVGGITGWRRVAEAAALRGIGIASHVSAHYNVPLLSGISNAVTLEYVPWWPNPFEQELQFVNGRAIPFDAPGFGLTLDEARLKHNPA